MAVFRSFIVVCVIALSLVAPAKADDLEDILERGTVRIGVSLFTPWTIRSDDGELSGFEIEVGRRLAKDMGVEAEFIVFDWPDIIPALINDEIDVIAGGMAITPQRALLVNFTQPYADGGVALAANRDRTRRVEGLEDLNQSNVTIVAVAETFPARVARTLFNAANVTIVNTEAEAEAALVAGDAHVYVASLSEARLLAARHPDDVDVPINRAIVGSKAGLAVRKGEHDWLTFLNAWIVSVEAERWLQTTHDYWFTTLDWAQAPTN